MRQRHEVARHVGGRAAGIQDRIGGEIAHGAEHDGVSVRLGLGDALGRDQPVGARTVLDDDRLPSRSTSSARSASQDVDSAAGRESDHDADGSRRKGGLASVRRVTNGVAAAPSTNARRVVEMAIAFLLFVLKVRTSRLLRSLDQRTCNACMLGLFVRQGQCDEFSAVRRPLVSGMANAIRGRTRRKACQRREVGLMVPANNTTWRESWLPGCRRLDRDDGEDSARGGASDPGYDSGLSRQRDRRWRGGISPAAGSISSPMAARRRASFPVPPATPNWRMLPRRPPAVVTTARAHGQRAAARRR